MRAKCLLIVCLLTLIAGMARADKTWVGPTNGGDWAVATNWSGSAVPADGDVVSISGAVTVRLGSATAQLSDFSITNATVIVTNWDSHIQATNVTVRNSGRILLAGPFATNEPASRISIICTNLTVLTGGLIAADAQGYKPTFGPGAGKINRGNGASYGGLGGLADQSFSLATWTTYGDPADPQDPGSGGGVNGSAGGGVIRIDASGTADINGTLSAGGGAATVNYGSGGSGGSILLQCGTFSGTGLVRVVGGNAISPGGGGGGGRMAVRYATAPSPWPRLRFSAAPGAGYAASAPYVAQWGTLWLTGTEVLQDAMTPSIFTSVQLIPGVAAGLTLGSFQVVSNTFRIASTNFQLTVTGDMTVLTNANVGVYNLDVGGSLLLTNGGIVTVNSAATNGVGPDYGSLLRVTNQLLVSPNSRLRLVAEDRTGAGPLVKAGIVRIADRGLVDADYAGFRPATGPGAGDATERASGGGYGGLGGKGQYGGVKGLTYGSPAGPALAGSGGNGDIALSLVGGYGGGLVRLESTGTVEVAGTISANGGSVGFGYGGGGSGGGVFIVCDRLSGGTSGVIRVNGGTGSGNTSGGGGGGRIALNYSQATPWPGIRMQAKGGTGYTGQFFPFDSKIGTVYLSDFAMMAETLDANQIQDAYLYLTNAASWAPDHLAISNCSLLFGVSNFTLTVTNAVTISTNGALGAYQVNCGSLTLTNGGSLTLTALPTNGMAYDEWSGGVAVTQDLTIGFASWIYAVSDPVNGGSVKLSAGNVSIGAGAGINASVRGFSGTRGPGGGFNSGRRSGGGYGGRGGVGSTLTNDTYGAANGSLIAPVRPGSGGGRTDYGGWGGGLIRLEAAGAVRLDGTMMANGGNFNSSSGYNPAGGAGGGIFVLGQTFAGDATGRLLASGGNGASDSGGGGGGRIAVGVGLSASDRQILMAGGTPSSMTLYEAQAGFNGSMAAAPGTGYAATDLSLRAQTGTCTFLSAGSSLLTIRGDPDNFGQPFPDDYGSIITIPPGSRVTNSVVTPADETNGLRRASLGWTLTLTNGSPVDAGSGSQAVFDFTNEMILTWRWTNEWRLILTNGPNGSVNSGSYLPWYTNDTLVGSITASPAGGYVFDRWIGDVPADAATNNPLAVVMTRARTLEAVFAAAGGGTRIWSGNGRWQDHASWSPAGMPGREDAVIISSGTVSVAESFQCASLAVNAGSVLLFTNWDNRLSVAGAATIASGGTVRVARSFPDAGPSNRVWLACGTLVVGNFGLITADGLGFSIGQGVTHSVVGASYRGSGGGHGGRGGYASQDYVGGGGAYDSLEEPQLAGGGGANDTGGSGGGAIRLEIAGAATVEGTITAKGSPSTGNGGGGAGGSIWMQAGSVAGATSGLIRVSGGACATEAGGAGGGGRLAIHGAVASPFGVRLQAGRGSGGFASSSPEGQMSYVWPARGTVYLTDPGWLTPVLEAGRFEDVSLFVSGMTSWAAGQVSLNQVSLHFGQPGFTVTATNGIVLDGASKLGVWGLATEGDCRVTNGAWLCLYAQPSNGPLPAAGATVEVGQALVIGSNSWVMPFSDSTNGGSVRVRAGSLAVAAGGGFDALGRGYRGGSGPGRGSAGNYGGGGGYGGAGGYGGTGAGGVSNGWAAVPERPGSGGGQNLPGYGGGLIWIESAGIARLDGTLMADGGRSWSDGGGGSGGGVLLACRSLSLGTDGRIWARGGSSGNLSTGGGGSGGRVAVWLKMSESQRVAALSDPAGVASSARLEITNAFEGMEIQMSVTNGMGYTNAYVGTIRFLVGYPTTGALILIR